MRVALCSGGGEQKHGVIGPVGRGHRKRGRAHSAFQEDRANLCIQRLESRTLLDASAVLSQGILSIVGGPGRDRLSVLQNGSQLVVQDHGQTIGQFSSAAVNSIDITAGGSNNYITIAPNVLQPANIQGSTGTNVFRAGGGPTTLTGGNGVNQLIGGPGGDTLIGGSGRNTLVSKGANDVLVAGNGKNKLFARLTDTLVGVGAGDEVVGLLDPLPPVPAIPAQPPADTASLTPTDVDALLKRAAAATPSDSAIVAVVDREGNILGVRVEGNVSPVLTNPNNTSTLVFAIDGAVAEARTGAFFANDQAPLTSRTIEDISQSTITQREVQSNPSITDPNSTVAGPGFVAAVGINAHFPPGVPDTPQVDLYNIEASNRDTTVKDGVTLAERFNADPAFVPAGQNLPSPNSYGYVSGLEPNAQPRGIGTLPGGVPIYEHVDPNDPNSPLELVGGIGVFFPGTTGYATEENSSLSLQAEAIALAAVGGSSTLSSPDLPAGSFYFANKPLGGVTVPQFDLPSGQINLVGITLDIFGPGGPNGPDVLLNELTQLGLGQGDPLSGLDYPVVPGQVPTKPLANQVDAAVNTNGTAVPEGWLVTPHAGGGLSADDVERIVAQGITQALQTRAAIRLPLDSHTAMTFAVTDSNGDVLGLYRMSDSTYFSIDVAVAKARNVSYYADPSQLQPIDQLPGVAAGTAFSSRTFRYLADARFPEGIDGAPPGPFSILNDGHVDPVTGANIGAPLPASAYFNTVQGNDAFNPGTNFHQPASLNQNGIIFFPGGVPLYKNGQLVGGLGVSGDGVDQDDVVTYGASKGYGPPPGVQTADDVIFDGVRLPYQKFNRQPQLP